MLFNLKKADQKKFKETLKQELNSIEDSIELGKSLFFNNFLESSNIGNFLQQIEEFLIVED